MAKFTQYVMFFSLILICSCEIYSNYVYGVITDEQTGEPLENVKIYTFYEYLVYPDDPFQYTTIEKTDITTTTNENGEYSFTIQPYIDYLSAAKEYYVYLNEQGEPSFIEISNKTDECNIEMVQYGNTIIKGQVFDASSSASMPVRACSSYRFRQTQERVKKNINY